MILYFDTETSGLYPGRIIQLAYIMDNRGELSCKNFYFAVDYIEPSAIAVHGISVDKLKVLSDGKTFSDYADEIYDDFISADMVVAHNFRFDLSFMIAEFRYLDRIFRYNSSFDTMKYFTSIMKLSRGSTNSYKYPKLTELTEFAEVYPYDVTKFALSNFNGTTAASHDARFDTAAMYLACRNMKGRIDELNDIL